MAAINRFIPLFSSQSGAVPTASQMEDGELAINTADGRLFTKQGNQIIMLAGHIQVSSSWAATASYVPNLYPAGAIPIMSGGGVVVNNPVALNFLGSGVSVTNNANTASITIVSGAANWTNLVNIPVGLVSSSTQYSTGSYTGSFTGSLLGSGTYALSASAATSITFTPPTASYSITSSFARSASYAGTDWNAINNKPTVFSSSAQLPTGLVSSSVQINTGSFTGSFTGSLLGSSSYALSSSWAARSVSASYAGTDWNAINNKPTVVSASAQYNTGSYTGSFTGSLLGSASYALSSSWSARSVSASYAGTDWNAINNKPTIVSASAQINTGSFTGSFTGSLLGSASYALTSSYAMNGGSGGVSSSYAVTASYASLAQNVLGSITSASYAATSSWSAYAVTSSYFSGTIEFPTGLVVTGSVTASAYTGSLTGSLLGSASYALSASWAPVGVGVSASYAITSSWAATASYAAAFSGSIANAISASYSTYAVTASYISGGIDLSSGLIVTGTVTATAFVGTGSGIVGVVSSSYATTASYAMNGGSGGVSSSYAVTASYASLAQNVLGSITSASYALTASFATTAITASYFSGTVDFTNGMTVTGSTISTQGFTGSLSGTAALATSASYALTASYAMAYSGSITNAVSASYALTALTASYVSGGINFPSGLTVTGTLTATTFVGTGSGIVGVVSSSYAVTSSYAMNGGSGGVSSSYATTSSFASTARSASFATTSITASYFSTSVNFPAGLDVTGTLVATTGVTILRSGSLSLEATVTNNPIGILALTGTLPFTKLYNSSSNNTTLQIPSGTVTGSVFELVYSNMNSSTRNIMFPDVRVKDSIATAATWSVANSASVFFQFRYLPNFSASTTGMYWMPMFTQSIS